MAVPLPSNEAERLEAVRDCGVMDSPREDAYDNIARLAAFTCNAPIAAITLIDSKRQWFKSIIGLPTKETPREIAFCSYTILQSELLLVPDATQDERFSGNPLVTGETGIRFYAGVPLITGNGHALGTLFVLDRKRRNLTVEQQEAMMLLARQVIVSLELASRIAAQDRLNAEREAALALQRKSEERFQAAFNNAAVGASITDLTGQFLVVNGTFCTITGYSEEELRTSSFAFLTHPDDLATNMTLVQQLQRGQIPSFVTEKRYIRKDGSVAWVQNSVSLTHDEQGRPEHMVAITENISEKKKAQERAAQLLLEAQERANTDALTGLLNHRAFYSRLDEEAIRTMREETSFAVIMLDLDNFKFFNDVYGHAAGDNVLRLVADRLRGACRAYDTLARFGGDEFALLLPGIGAATAEEIEIRLRGTLNDVFFQLKDQDVAIPVTISLGAAVFPAISMDPHEVLHHADERLLWSKTGGSGEAARLIRTKASNRVQGFSMLDALVTAVDNKDRYTRRHSEDVMNYSVSIAQELGLDDHTQRMVAIAALLHDVGKIGVPDSILRKPGRLSGEEFEAVKLHPVMGAIMVGAVPGLEETLDAIRHHHERWDGRGYPHGLKGKEIPLVARLMAVADAFSAMTMDRPYRQGLKATEAIRILTDGSGAHWDQECVGAFVRGWTKGQQTEQTN